MKSAILKFMRDEQGATAIEYGIIAGMMAVVLIGIFGPTGSIGTALIGVFNSIAGSLDTAR